MEENNPARAASPRAPKAGPGREPAAFCCGQHAVCERDLLVAAGEEPVDYFDDEELDRFRGRRADAYTADEEEEFRDVLYTTLVREVPDWLRSLRLRGIELPAGLQDEALMLADEPAAGTPASPDYHP